MANTDRLPTRRGFLKTSAAGLAGAAVLGGCSRPRSSAETPRRTGRPIVRTLGRTGLSVPVVSMGTAYAVNMVAAALDAGITYIHTSSSYAERNHERLMGEVFRRRPRESFIVASSPDLPYYPDQRGDRSLDIGTNVDVALIPESIEGSLQRLRIDAVDIYYLASVNSRRTALHEPYIRAFEQLKTARKARFTGITTHSNEPEVIRAAVESGFWDVVLTAYNFRQSHREEVREAIVQAAEAGLGVVAMKTQAGVYWDAGRRRKINMTAAMKWALRDEHVHTAIPAFSNYDELREAVEVMEDPALTPEEEQDLRLGEQLGLAGLYCQQCGRCLPQCPAGEDVPTLMRAHMYAAGHGQPAKARAVLGPRRSADIACLHCDRCDVRCALGFDVQARALSLDSRYL